MTEKTKSKPPYPSTGQADELLDIFRRVSPKKIDSKFVAENKIATAPNASSVVNFAKWLGITDEEGNVKDEVANKLRLVGEERTKFIAELIKTAYKEVFTGVNLQEASRDDLVNFFIHNYNYGIAPAKNASILLLHLCDKYGIPVAEELKKKTYNNPENSKKGEKRQIVARVRNKSSSMQPPEDILFKEGTIVLSIRGNGLNKQIEAKNASELQKVYEGKFKSWIEGAKHLFDEEINEEETLETN